MLTAILIFVVGVAIAAQARRHLTFAMIALQLFLLVVVCLGALQLESRQDDLAKNQEEIQQTQHRLTRERNVRSRVQAEINRYVCVENNKQDGILAGLVEISVKGTTTFGAGVDRSKLSDFDIGVMESIARIQKLTEANQSEFKRAFDKALRQLRDKTPCTTVVKAFLAASTTDDLKAIRRILREASDGLLKPTQAHHHKRKEQP